MNTPGRRILPIAVAMASAVTLAMASCSGETEGEASSAAQGGTGASSGGTLALADLCDAFVDDLCTVLMQCAGWDYCDLDHCRADQECLGMASLQGEIASGWVEYDPVAAGACHDKLKADPCNFGSFLFVPTVPEVLVRCPGVLTPKQGAGQSCASPVDCTQDTHCIATSGCPGTCTPWLTQGEPCQIGAGPRCDPRIDLECRDGTCKMPWALGDPCAAAADCFPLWCDMTAGTCKPAAKAGEACDNGGQMAPHCDQDLDLWCDSRFNVGVCQPLSPSGGPCLNDSDCQEPLTCLPDMGFPNPGICGDRVPIGGACDSFNDCIDNLCNSTYMCIPRAGEGEACSTSLPCKDGLSCEQAVCRPPTCPGAPCDAAQNTCSLSLCKNQVCTPRAALGEACAVDDDCASRSCNAGTCGDPEGCAP